MAKNSEIEEMTRIAKTICKATESETERMMVVSRAIDKEIEKVIRRVMTTLETKKGRETGQRMTVLETDKTTMTEREIDQTTITPL